MEGRAQLRAPGWRRICNDKLLHGMGEFLAQVPPSPCQSLELSSMKGAARSAVHGSTSPCCAFVVL